MEDEDAQDTARRAGREEAITAGISSSGIVAWVDVVGRRGKSERESIPTILEATR